MNNENNFEYELKKRFNEEAPELPESLKKENVIAMLEKDKLQPKKKKKHIFPKILASAAALIIVVASAAVAPILIPDKPLVDVTTTTSPENETVTEPTTNTLQNQINYEVISNGFEAKKLKQAESNEEIQNHFLKIYRENKLDNFIDDAFGRFETLVEDGLVVYNESASDAAAPGTAIGTTSAAMAATMAQSSDMLTGTGGEDKKHGVTNTQVENVDEADIIKNDGRYLYILSGGVYIGNRTVKIVDTESMSLVSKIEIADEKYGYNIEEMYVIGDRLVLLASKYEIIVPEDEKSRVASYDVAYPYYYGGNREIVSFLYDISDRSKPALVRKVSQDGSRYVSSRMIDGVLYTVSEYWVRGENEQEVKENAVPSVNGNQIICDCIYVYDYDSNSYIVVSAYDTATDNAEVNTLSVLGSSCEVYCSRDALYIANNKYDYDNGDYCEIFAFGINKDKLSYKASGTVRGRFLNQFSFDEHNGNLRVATTYYSYKHDVDVSSIYVLNKDLQLIGQLEDIAYDEQVKSVRFMGDVGYIVTFRNTDPLFTVDLSDPTAPKIIGEVKLPGFSSYLHPVGEGLVVGLGYDGDEENADFSSIKVSLFDVSDLKNPKEADTFVLKNVTSAALYNHKAFIYYPEENIIGFPVEHYEEGTVLSYKLLKIENKVIENHLGYVHKTERFTGDVFRGTYIDDKLYTVDNYNVCEFEINTAALTRECEILDIEKDMPDKNIYGEEVTSPAVMPGGVVATTVAPNNQSIETTVGTTTSRAPEAPDAVTDKVVLPDYAQVPEETTVPTTVADVTVSMPKTVVTFDALVIKAADSVVLVEVTAQGESGLSVGSQVTFPTIPEQELAAGDTIRVTFDGVVMETYPAQLGNIFAIERIG